MRKLTDKEYARLLAAFVNKHKGMCLVRSLVEEDIRTIIGTVMVDTELVLSEVLTIEDFEG